MTAPRPEPRELPDELLELVIGGAGDPPPGIMARLQQAGAIRPLQPAAAREP